MNSGDSINVSALAMRLARRGLADEARDRLDELTDNQLAELRTDNYRQVAMVTEILMLRRTYRPPSLVEVGRPVVAEPLPAGVGGFPIYGRRVCDCGLVDCQWHTAVKG